MENKSDDRWLDAYRVVSVALLTTIASILAYIGVGVISGQEMLRVQLSTQALQISVVLVRLEQNQKSIELLTSSAVIAVDKVNSIDNRLNRLEATKQ